MRGSGSWLPALYPLFAAILAWASVWLAARVGLAPIARCREGHWTERARHTFPVVRGGSLALPLLTLFALFLGHRLTGNLSVAPPALVGAGSGLGAFLGAYLAIFSLAKKYRSEPIAYWKSVREYLVWISIHLLPLCSIAVIAVSLAPDSLTAGLGLALAIVLVGVLVHRGAGLAIGRIAGLIHSPDPRLLEVCAAAAKDLGVPMPRVEQADFQRGNAFAFPLAGRLLFTTGLLKLLDDEELAAVARHELAHLAEPARVKIARFLPIVALAPMVFIPGLLGREAYGAAALLVVVPLVLVVSVATLSRFWEKDADHKATQGAPSPAYARALERIYEASLIPVVLGRTPKTHPDLYDRVIAAGGTLSYPRPAPPDRWRGMAFAFVLGGVLASPALLLLARAWLRPSPAFPGSDHFDTGRAPRWAAYPAEADTTAGTESPERVSFPTSDGGFVHADMYGEGDAGVVLAHGGRFNKESWAPQARTLAVAGFRVLALDFRGYGQSRGSGEADPLSAPLHLDVLAAVRYLRGTGATSVSVVGASMGAGAAADASVEAKPGEIDRIVLLSGRSNRPPEKLQGRKLFILSRGDVGGPDVPRLPGIRAQYEKAPEPKELVILEGSAHAQAIFETDQGDRLMREILRFLSEPPTGGAPGRPR
jgi:Zn-dependent protease with chaperone function/dienelactone hydrolase